MRLFIGIGLDDETKTALLGVRERLEGISSHADELRWSQPESWHVTLQFLGQAKGEQAQCVTERLGEVRSKLVPVQIEGLGFFERVGVFWAGVALTPELLALEQKVVAAMRRCGFAPEGRAYRPHITLARARGRTGGRALKPLQKAAEDQRLKLRAQFMADEFLLYESFTGPEGSRYEVRGRWGLGDRV